MTITKDQIIKNKLFVGGLAKFLNPKMKKYCKGKENGIVLLDEDMVLKQLENAKQKISKYLSAKKSILLVSQQSLFSDDIVDIAQKKGIFYMNSKVPSGFLTNFDTLIKSVKKMESLQKFVNSDKFIKLTKKEQSTKKRELSKMEKVYLGVSGLLSIPDLVVVVNGTIMKGVVKEIGQMGVDNIVITSSAFDKRWEDNSLITINVDSYISVLFTLKTIFGL